MGYHGLPISSEHGIGRETSCLLCFLTLSSIALSINGITKIGQDTVGNFYADGGRIAGFTRETVQKILMFSRICLFILDCILMSLSQTYGSVSHHHPDFMSNITFKWHFDPDIAGKLTLWQCPCCSHAVSNQYLPTHIHPCMVHFPI